MFSFFRKNKTYTDEELFRALQKDGIAVTEEEIQKARENDPDTLYKIGDTYYKNKEYDKSFPWFHKAALQEHEEAQAQIGWMYQNGEGVSVDYQQAMDWSMKAASTGNATGQHTIARSYYFGYGVSQDYKQAMDWLMKVANNGHEDGMFLIGLMYHRGYGVTKNIPTAIEWCTKAANQGHKDAQLVLGLIYDNNDEAEDLQKAVNWYQKAADNGDWRAKCLVKLTNLGGHYARNEEQEDKGVDQVVDMNSITTRTIENINQKMKEDLESSKNCDQSMVDLTEEMYKMRIEALQKERELHEKQYNEETKQLREEVAKLKALLENNNINDTKKASDDDKVYKKKGIGSDTPCSNDSSRIEHNSEKVVHPKVVDSDSNSVDLNYDSDDNYDDLNYDSSDSEDLTKDLCLD